MKISEKSFVIVSTVICALAMSIVDGVIQPPYAVKSAVKVILFLLMPIACFALQEKKFDQLKGLFLPCSKDFKLALILGVGVYALIAGGYSIFAQFVDISEIVLQLTADNGVTADNFVLVSLYICLVNSMLEEFFFRGFAFITLRRTTSRKFAYVFSAIVFAIYHFGMVAGGMHIWLWVLAMSGLFLAGVFLNWLNERNGNIITSWLVHMFANLAINTIGFTIFDMI